MRVTITIDSATAEEARALVVAFQRTREMGLPKLLSELPTVQIMGMGWGVETPPMYLDRAVQVVSTMGEQS
jgi:hypothetical protein